MPPAFDAIPVLRIFDVEKARQFYVGFLGFRVDWEHRFEPGFPLYLQVSRDGLVLHLSEHHGDGSPAPAWWWGYGYSRPGLEVAPWNARVMEVTDPFGNRLRFNEPIAPASHGSARHD